MACNCSATNGSTATLHGRELPTELPVQTLQVAITAYSETIRLDPNNALAYAGRAHAY